MNSEDGDGDKVSEKHVKRIGVELLTGLKRLRQDEKFCDIILRAGGEEILAHKNVLCACSPYFNAMFTGPFIETAKEEIEVKDVEPDMLKLLIDYIYTGRLDHNPDNVERILLSATFLQITSAADICTEYLSRSINEQTCLKFIQFAGKHSIKKLFDKALKILGASFHQLFMTEPLMMLEYDEFQKVMRQKNVRDYPEDIICTTVLRWIQYDPDHRTQYLADLLQLLNPCLISSSILGTTVELTDDCREIVQEWLDNYQLTDYNDPDMWEVFLSKKTGKFDPRTYKITGESSRKLAKVLSNYRDINDGSYVAVGYNIYHQGGWISRKGVIDQTFCLDVQRNLWMPFVPMKYARAYHRSCELGGVIYTMGGSDGYKAFDFVESLDLYSGRVSVLASLPKRKESMGIGVHANAIYSVGGRDRWRHLGCVHRYDPRIGDTWDTIPTNPYEMGVTSCAVVNDDIYCGNGESLQRYDVRGNKWTLIHTQYKRYPDELFTVNNELYGLFKDHFAKYQPDQGKWKVQLQFKFHFNNLTVTPNLFAVPVPLPQDEPSDNELANESSDDDRGPGDGDDSDESNSESNEVIRVAVPNRIIRFDNIHEYLRLDRR